VTSHNLGLCGDGSVGLLIFALQYCIVIYASEVYLRLRTVLNKYMKFTIIPCSLPTVYLSQDLKICSTWPIEILRELLLLLLLLLFFNLSNLSKFSSF